MNKIFKTLTETKIKKNLLGFSKARYKTGQIFISAYKTGGL